jgi:transcriptional regulator with XRE-family HTH domain
MSLPELRQRRNVSQAYLAASMNKKQPNLSKLERSADMYVSTLCKFIQAMGGNLEIVAHFPDGEVRINQFEKLKR